MRPLLSAVIFILVVLCHKDVLAITKTWAGVAGGSGDWFSAANWSPSGVPQIDDDVIIAQTQTSTTAVDVISSASAISVRSISLSSSSHLEVVGATLSVSFSLLLNGTLYLDAATVNLPNEALTVQGSIMVTRASIINANITIKGTGTSSTGRIRFLPTTATSSQCRFASLTVFNSSSF